MSLRRRPAETATYIPRSQHGNNGGNGFALTSSGALGFSDDIENQLSYTTSCNASSRAETMKTSANPGEGGKKAISCNRDAVASIRPFSSMTRTMMNPMHEEQQQHSDEDEEEEMHTAFGLGMDEEDEMMHTGAPMEDHTVSAWNKVKGAHLKAKEMARMHAKQEFSIENAYVRYITLGRCKDVEEMLERVKKSTFRLENVPHRIFKTMDRYTSSPAEYTHHFDKMTADEKIKITDYRDQIKDYWKRSYDHAHSKEMTFEEFEKLKPHLSDMNMKTVGVSKSDLMRAYYYEKCMETYKKASEFVKSFERRGGFLYEKKTSNGTPSAGAKKQVASMKDMHNKPSVSSWSHTPDEGFGRTKSFKSIGDSSSSLSSIRAMLQQKTRDLQMKLGANMRSDHEEHEFCTCAEPQPVPINHESMYCTCKEPEPVQLGESMYCTCKNPVPVLSTGDRMPRSDKGTKETKYLGGDEYFEEQHDHQSKKQGKKKAGEHNRTETTTFPHGTRTAKVNAGHSVEHNRARHTNGNGHNDARGYGGMRSGQPMSVKDILAMRGF